jgi:hypothetical protein
MKSLASVDRWLGRHFERWSSNLSGGSHPKEALEIRREILSAVRDRIEPKGDGEYLFPYQEILVRLGARDNEHRDALMAAFVDENALEGQVRELLGEAECRGAESVAVAVEVLDDPEAPPFKLEFRRVDKGKVVAGVAAGPRRPAAWLYVTKGKSDQTELFVGRDTVFLGRLKEVNSKDGGLRRRNDIAFDDSENTVSREHAHIRFEDGKFRLYHDLGERPTRLFREGRAVDVPVSGGRGTQLRSGDEIHLGEARLKFEVGE